MAHVLPATVADAPDGMLGIPMAVCHRMVSYFDEILVPA